MKTDKKAKRLAKSGRAANAELGWVRQLSEVGPVMTDRIDQYRRRYERYLELLDEAQGVKHDLFHEKKNIERLVREQWTEAEIFEAHRLQIEEWHAELTGAKVTR